MRNFLARLKNSEDYGNTIDDENRRLFWWMLTGAILLLYIFHFYGDELTPTTNAGNSFWDNFRF